jgi:hypothetical protein
MLIHSQLPTKLLRGIHRLDMAHAEWGTSTLSSCREVRRERLPPILHSMALLTETKQTHAVDLSPSILARKLLRPGQE